MTLRFIGQVEEPEVAYIISALSSVRAESFDLVLFGVGHFESLKKIWSLWTGIQNCPALGTPHKRIESVLTRYGIGPDARKNWPHITLAGFKFTPPIYVYNWLEGNSYFQKATE